ncbi:hypothetical protein NE454_11140 [Blautia producta]|nr:hypothetical protein [Blautia producta]MCQ5124967.1 hypothetical protein [Blautia producta]
MRVIWRPMESGGFPYSGLQKRESKQGAGKMRVSEKRNEYEVLYYSEGA